MSENPVNASGNVNQPVDPTILARQRALVQAVFSPTPEKIAAEVFPQATAEQQKAIALKMAKLHGTVLGKLDQSSKELLQYGDNVAQAESLKDKYSGILGLA